MTNPALGSSWTCSSRVSTLTPLQRVSSFVHLVTQWMSTVKSWAGSPWTSSHDQRTGFSTCPSMLKVHFSSGVRGVGPAESTGKSATPCCPGGRRSPGALSCRLPTKPRETKRSPISPPFITWITVEQDRPPQPAPHPWRVEIVSPNPGLVRLCPPVGYAQSGGGRGGILAPPAAPPPPP